MKNSIFAAIVATAASGLVVVGSLGAMQPASDTAQSGHAASELAWRAAAARFGGVEADTRPSRDVTMRFSFSTEVREVLVTGAQPVKKGDVLLRARDSFFVAAMDLQRLRAENDLEIQAAQTALELAEYRLRNVQEARERLGSTPAELEERRIEREQARLGFEQAKVRHREAQLTFAQAEGQFEQFRLEAPFDGIVEEVYVEVGQGVGEQVPVIRLVNVDQLWLDAYPRTHEAQERALKEGSAAWVLLNLAGGAKVVQGKVLYVSPVADSVSQRIRVRVEIPNVGSWPAGTSAAVRFSEPAGEWAWADGAVAARNGGGPVGPAEANR